MTNIPLVSVCMITYNHESFIAEAIEGVLMQQTNFPIELIIGEDCSTDNTRKVVREYEEKYSDTIIAHYPETNRGMSDNFITTMKSSRGRYIALCEGDDYWTDPLKLQKQIDFLETNMEYSTCCHFYSLLRNDVVEKREYPLFFKSKHVSLFDSVKYYSFDRNDNLNYFVTQPLTAVFRRDIIDQIPFDKYALFRDIHLFYHLLSHGKGALLCLYSGVYRKHSGGIFSATETNLMYYRNLLWSVYRDLYKCNINDIMLKRKTASYELLYNVCKCDFVHLLIAEYKYIVNVGITIYSIKIVVTSILEYIKKRFTYI